MKISFTLSVHQYQHLHCVPHLQLQTQAFSLQFQQIFSAEVKIFSALATGKPRTKSATKRAFLQKHEYFSISFY